MRFLHLYYNNIYYIVLWRGTLYIIMLLTLFKREKNKVTTIILCKN